MKDALIFHLTQFFNAPPCETQMFQIVTLHGGYLYQIAHFCITNLTKGVT